MRVLVSPSGYNPGFMSERQQQLRGLYKKLQICVISIEMEADIRENDTSSRIDPGMLIIFTLSKLHNMFSVMSGAASDRAATMIARNLGDK